MCVFISFQFHVFLVSDEGSGVNLDLKTIWRGVKRLLVCLWTLPCCDSLETDWRCWWMRACLFAPGAGCSTQRLFGHSERMSVLSGRLMATAAKSKSINTASISMEYLVPLTQQWLQWSRSPASWIILEQLKLGCFLCFHFTKTNLPQLNMETFRFLLQLKWSSCWALSLTVN